MHDDRARSLTIRTTNILHCGMGRQSRRNQMHIQRNTNQRHLHDQKSCVTRELEIAILDQMDYRCGLLSSSHRKDKCIFASWRIYYRRKCNVVNLPCAVTELSPIMDFVSLIFHRLERPCVPLLTYEMNIGAGYRVQFV